MSEAHGPSASSTRWHTDAYFQAAIFAANAHAGRVFPGTKIPYAWHLNLTAMEVLSALTEEAACGLQPGRMDFALQCAFLSGIVTETDTRLEEVRGEFGGEIAAAIAALTPDHGLPENPPARLRTLDQIRRLMRQPREVRMVKLSEENIRLRILRLGARNGMPEMLENAAAFAISLQEGCEVPAARLRVQIRICQGK